MMRLIISPCGCRAGYIGEADKPCVEWVRCATHTTSKDAERTRKAEEAKAATDPDEYVWVQRSYTN